MSEGENNRISLSVFQFLSSIQNSLIIIFIHFFLIVGYSKFNPSIIHSLINIAIIVATIIAMEILSWTMHKYLFHGPLWFIHKTHHQQRHGFFELNDIFSLGFGALALWLMWMGHETLSYKFWIGTGISIYGVIYFIFHDWFIHNRLKAFKSENRYLKGIRRAHKTHHKTTEKEGSEEFGLLMASKKYFEN